MSWTDFFSLYVIIGIVGFFFILIIVCLISVVISLHRQIGRLDTAINLLKHDKRMKYQLDHKPKGRETLRLERQQTLTASRLKKFQNVHVTGNRPHAM